MEGQLSFTTEIEMHFPAWICIYAAFQIGDGSQVKNLTRSAARPDKLMENL